MGAEATSDVTSAGPVKLSDLQRILSNIGSAGMPDFLVGWVNVCVITYYLGNDRSLLIFSDVDEAVDPEAGMGFPHSDALWN